MSIVDSPPMAGDIFLLHPRNADFVAGYSNKPKGLIGRYAFETGIWIFVAILFVFAGAVGVYLNLQARAGYLERKQDGIIITGTMLERDSVRQYRSKRSYTEYRLTYSYQVAGQEYIKQEKIDANVYESFRPNAPIDVLYLPDESSNAIIAAQHKDPLRQAAFNFLLMMGSLLGLGFTLYKQRQRAKLFAQGVMVRGELLGQYPSTWYRKRFKISIEYAFISPHTQRHITHEMNYVDDRVARRLKTALNGAPLMILYWDDEHHEPL